MLMSTMNNNKALKQIFYAYFFQIKILNADSANKTYVLQTNLVVFCGSTFESNSLFKGGTFESKTHNHFICLIRERSAYCHQSNVPPQTAVFPLPWRPWQ